MDPKLLPCPFCGSTKITVVKSEKFYIVFCRECKASCNYTERKEDAIYLWNKRAERVGCYVPMHQGGSNESND